MVHMARGYIWHRGGHRNTGSARAVYMYMYTSAVAQIVHGPTHTQRRDTCIATQRRHICAGVHTHTAHTAGADTHCRGKGKGTHKTHTAGVGTHFRGKVKGTHCRGITHTAGARAGAHALQGHSYITQEHTRVHTAQRRGTNSTERTRRAGAQ